jgi:hypothetical protein
LIGPDLKRLQEAISRDCQRPSVSPHPRSSHLPTGGHDFSPLAAIRTPHRAGVLSTKRRP